jgi:hypothetical protein
VLQSAFGKATIEMNDESFMRSATPAKRSAARALRVVTKNTSFVLQLLDVASHVLTTRDGGNAGFAGAKTGQSCALI